MLKNLSVTQTKLLSAGKLTSTCEDLWNFEPHTTAIRITTNIVGY